MVPVTVGLSPVSELLVRLVGIDSTNPSLVSGGAGEGEIVRFLSARLRDAAFEIDVWDVRPGRPNLVARLPGRDAGRTLMICGHTDVVGADPAGFEPRFEGGRIYGRGSFDMKGGLAAAIIAAERVSKSGSLSGDLLLAFCIDEEWRSEGAEALVERYQAEAAIFPEPSNLEVVTAHGGFAWYDVVSEGVEAPGGDAARGLDAISLLGPILTGIAQIDRNLSERASETWGRGSIHASTIVGGVTYPSYPARCQLAVERCLIPGESVADSDAEIAGFLEAAESADGRFRGSWERVVGREPVVLDPKEPVVKTVVEAAAGELGCEIEPRFEIGWMDSGVLSDAGIPCVVFGPSGAGEHTPDEWVDANSLDACVDVFERAIRSFCG
jgi:acetylornithine deacetylase